MPNWVYNYVDNYTEDLYNKYKSEDLDLDFNKIIPEPEEITKSYGGSFNSVAKEIGNYIEWKETDEYHNKYDSPLYRSLKDKADYIAKDIGYTAIANPDKSLNNIIKENENSFISRNYDSYVELYGNKRFDSLKNDEFLESCDRYCNKCNEEFENIKNSSINKDLDISKFNTVQEYAKHCNHLVDKYGTDNWYDWRCCNWGTKWNACRSEYNNETQQMTFETAWSVPDPIYSKIAEDNNDAKLDIYSEEETGWFVEEKTKDGKLYLTAEGELVWNPETDKEETNRVELDTPEEINIEKHKEQYKKFLENLRN